MLNTIKILAAAVAVAAVAGSAAAQPWGGTDLGRYDARAARSTAEQLALCDLASYFGTGPDLDAHRIYVQRNHSWYEPSSPTAITRGVQWHDEDLEHAYRRFRAAGRVNPDELRAVRRQYGIEMERAFRRTSVAERRFFQEQGRFCRDLARSAWRTAAR